MKAQEVHEMSNAELAAKLASLKSELFYHRFNHATGNLANPEQLANCKKDIARVLTVMREREIKGTDIGGKAAAKKPAKATPAKKAK